MMNSPISLPNLLSLSAPSPSSVQLSLSFFNQLNIDCFRSQDGINWTALGVNTNGTSFNDLGLIPDTNYQYKFVVSDKNGYSYSGPIMNVKTAPSAVKFPINLTSGTVSQTGVFLSWGGTTSISPVVRRSVDGVNFLNLNQTPKISMTDVVSPGSTYQYCVGFGPSGYFYSTAPLSVNTAMPAPLLSVVTSQNKAVLTWH